MKQTRSINYFYINTTHYIFIWSNLNHTFRFSSFYTLLRILWLKHQSMYDKHCSTTYTCFLFCRPPLYLYLNLPLICRVNVIYVFLLLYTYLWPYISTNSYKTLATLAHNMSQTKHITHTYHINVCATKLCWINH